MVGTGRGSDPRLLRQAQGSPGVSGVSLLPPPPTPACFLKYFKPTLRIHEKLLENVTRLDDSIS